MVYFCKFALGIFQTAKAKTIVFHFVFCIWMISFCLDICTLKQHSMSSSMQNKHKERHLVETENAISNCKNSFGGGIWEVCYIIAHSSNSMFRILLDPPDSLLQLNYLPNIIIDNACIFSWLEMPLCVNSFLILNSPIQLLWSNTGMSTCSQNEHTEIPSASQNLIANHDNWLTHQACKIVLWIRSTSNRIPTRGQ